MRHRDALGDLPAEIDAAARRGVLLGGVVDEARVAEGRADLEVELHRRRLDRAVADAARQRDAIGEAREAIALILRGAIEIGAVVELPVGLVGGEIAFPRRDAQAFLVIGLHPQLVAPLQRLALELQRCGDADILGIAGGHIATQFGVPLHQREEIGAADLGLGLLRPLVAPVRGDLHHLVGRRGRGGAGIFDDDGDIAFAAGFHRGVEHCPDRRRDGCGIGRGGRIIVRRIGKQQRQGKEQGAHERVRIAVMGAKLGQDQTRCCPKTVNSSL